jgi:hypothetical protein
VVMSENVRKLVGVVAMAALVVVGVVTTSGGDDDDFTRNAFAISSAVFFKLPEVEQARVGNSFVQQAASKAIDTGPIGQINKEVGPITKGAKASIVSTTGVDALSTGKASVLEGRGVDGKGGTASIQSGCGWNGKTCKAGIWSTGGVHGLSGRKASFRAGTAVNGVADRIAECASSYQRAGGYPDGVLVDPKQAVKSLKNVLVSSYTDADGEAIAELCSGSFWKVEEGESLIGKNPQVFPKVEMREAELLAECMEAKVGDVFLTSHIKSMAAKCVAIVLPALSPDRAIQLGTYWQTQQQLIGTD